MYPSRLQMLFMICEHIARLRRVRSPKQHLVHATLIEGGGKWAVMLLTFQTQGLVAAPAPAFLVQERLQSIILICNARQRQHA